MNPMRPIGSFRSLREQWLYNTGFHQVEDHKREAHEATNGKTLPRLSSAPIRVVLPAQKGQKEASSVSGNGASTPLRSAAFPERRIRVALPQKTESIAEGS